MEIIANRWEHASFLVVSGVPRASLCSGDELGALYTVLGRAGKKEAMGHAAGNVFLSGASKITLGDALGTVTAPGRTSYRFCMFFLFYASSWHKHHLINVFSKIKLFL
jgi:hypothetical protein